LRCGLPQLLVFWGGLYNFVCHFFGRFLCEVLILRVIPKISVGRAKVAGFPQGEKC
jgi:hypothetical protein